MKPLLAIILLLLAACGSEDKPDPIELSTLIDPESPAPEAEVLPVCQPPVLEIRLDDWQAFLDQPLGLEADPDRPVPRRLLRKWVPATLLDPGLASARLRVDALSVGVDATGMPGIRALDAKLVLDMGEGPARDALHAELSGWIRSMQTVLPQVPKLSPEQSTDTLVMTILIGDPPADRSRCQPAQDEIEPASGIHVRIGIQALLAVMEKSAGSLLLWSVAPEELTHWRTADLVIRPGGADRIALRLDTGTGELADLVDQARFPAHPGWDRFLPAAAPVTAGFFLHEAEAWTEHLSDLVFEKGFKTKDIDPVEILDDTWESQLGELLSGPAVGFPIVERYDLKKWDHGWIVYLQPKDISELDGRLQRVFNSKRYVIRPETFKKRNLTVVRYKKQGKGKVGGVRYAWYCEDTGCWLSRTMGGFNQLFDIEEGATSPQVEQVRTFMGSDVLAFAVLSPRTLGERFFIPEKKKKKPKKKNGKTKKKGLLPLPSLGDREEIARKVVENAVRGALTDLPEDLLVTAALRVDGDALELELTGLFRFVGRVATKFLPLL